MLRRPSMIYSPARISLAMRLPYSFLPYSRCFSCLRPTDNQENKDDITSWMKNSNFHEPTSTMHTPSTVEDRQLASGESLSRHPLVITISQEDYRRDWFFRFYSGDLSVVKSVINLAAYQRTIFSFEQIEILLKNLKYLRRNYEAHEIFCAYRKYLQYLRKNDVDHQGYYNFLEIGLGVENSLGNYGICEELFSEYIKFANLNIKIVTIGFRSFIKNNNLQLAREFYIQALNNSDAFPLTEKELRLFLRDLSMHGDYRSVHIFFNLWLRKRCEENDTEYLPSHELLSQIHEIYRKSGNEEFMTEFLSHEVIQKVGYPNGIFFELNEFYYSLHHCDTWSQFKLESKISYFLFELRHRQKKREEFYLFLLNFFALSKDFSGIKRILSLIQKDRDIRLKPKFYLAAARYFVKEGMLRDLIGYYSDVLKRRSEDKVHLRVSIIDQLYNCARFAHPNLSKEIANEFTLLLSKDEYIRQFPHLREFLRRLSRIRSSNTKVAVQCTPILDLPQVDYERLEIFENYIRHHDLVGAKSFILETLRRGIRPSFNLHYCILRRCLKLQLPALAKTMDELFLSTYRSGPKIKLTILWLRYDILSEYNAARMSSGSLTFCKLKVFSSKLLDFERHHQSALNFVSYMQLTQISLQIGEYEAAAGLLQRGVILIDEKDKRHLQMYYMTALKLSARVYDMRAFLKILIEWNENPNASLITRSSLRQLKSYIKLFAKRFNYIPHYDETLWSQILNINECLKGKYANLKFEGLDDVHHLMNFLKSWMLIEMHCQQTLFYNRRAILLNGFSPKINKSTMAYKKG